MAIIKVLLVLTAQLFCICLAQSDEGRRAVATEWTVNTYPNPISNFRGCGRTGPSFICDPNGILSEDKANRIDDVLKEIYNETRVPLRCYNTQGTKRKGYLVMVAILEKLQMNPEITTFVDRYYQAQLFSYLLSMYRWRNTACGEATLIFYSSTDNLFYISTQPVAREKLRDDLITDLNMEVLAMYSFPWGRGRNTFDAIKYVADRIKDIFA